MKLVDNYAMEWLEKLQTAMKKRVSEAKKNISADTESDDWWASLTWKKKGHCGMEMIAAIDKNEDITVFIKMNIEDWKKWVTEHYYMFHGPITFTIGPVVLYHGGVKEKHIDTKLRRVIDITEVELGILKEEEEVEWTRPLKADPHAGSEILVQLDGKSLPAPKNKPVKENVITFHIKKEGMTYSMK